MYKLLSIPLYAIGGVVMLCSIWRVFFDAQNFLAMLLWAWRFNKLFCIFFGGELSCFAFLPCLALWWIGCGVLAGANKLWNIERSEHV